MSAGYTLSAGARAFGDGAHPSTRGVLEALWMLDPVAFTPRIALDVGAGSGILSFAICERFGCPVVATDNDPQAVATLRENIATNAQDSFPTSPLRGEERIFPLQAEGFDHPEITAHAPYDLMVMNILAEPLLALAAEAEAHLAPEGVLILSGMLLWQEATVHEAYHALGLERTSRLHMGDWVTLVWQKP